MEALRRVKKRPRRVKKRPRGGEKNAPAGAGPAVESLRGVWKKRPHRGPAAVEAPSRSARRELIQSHTRRVVNLDT